MQPTDSPPSDPLLGNSLSGIIGCALDASTIPVSVADFPENWEPPTPGHIAVLLPQYQIESLIGRGGMGAVYKGRQITLQRPVAIKVLPAELARNTEFVARFHREAQLLASLSHQGIVTIFDFGQTTEGHLYFVMEYVDGTDLYRLIHKSGTQLDAKQALSLTVQICEAMQYAHDNGVVHRDIKPANVLVTRDGRAKLADFGLAMKPTDPDAMHVPPKPGAYFDPSQSPNVAEMRFTQPGAAMGTPDYAAPEVYDGKADERSDIYALGIMLYEMLTGAPPKGYFQLPSVMAQVDHRVDQVVVKALEIDPGARYQKVEQMKADVQAATQPLPPQPPPAKAPVAKPPAAIAAPTMPLAVNRPPAPPRNPPPSIRPSAGKRPRSIFGLLAWIVVLALVSGLGVFGWQMLAKQSKSPSPVAAAPATPSPQAKPQSAFSPTDPLVGRWWWSFDHHTTINADGTTHCTDGNEGRVEIGSAPRTYLLRWQRGSGDSMTLSEDGQSLDGHWISDSSRRITGHRLPDRSEPPPVLEPFKLEPGFTVLLDKDRTTGWQHVGKGQMKQQDGTFITSTPPATKDPWGIYCFTERTFSDFVLRVDFAVDSLGTNAGVLMGLSTPRDGAVPLFPPGSVEVEIQGPETGLVIGGAKSYWKQPFTARKWQTLEIAVIGTTITVQIDDKTVGTRILDRKLNGHIGLQNLGCCGSAYFRNLRVQELKAPTSAVPTVPDKPVSQPEADPTTQRLAELESQFRAAFDREAEKMVNADLADLEKSLTANGFPQAIADAQRRNASSDEAALTKERERFLTTRTMPAEDTPGVHPAVMKLRAKYRDARKAIEGGRKGKPVPSWLYESYLRELAKSSRDSSRLDLGMIKARYQEIAKAAGFSTVPLPASSTIEWQSRCGSASRERLRTFGGKPGVDTATARALEFLASKQNVDGSWGTDNRSGTTGLNLLAFLGHCETTESLFYGNVVLKAAMFLIEAGKKNREGLLSETPGNESAAKEHAIATCALGELYQTTRAGLKSLPGLREVYEKAVGLILRHRLGNHTWAGKNGGQGYWERSAPEPPTKDLLTTAWHYQALKIALESDIKDKEVEGVLGSAGSLWFDFRKATPKSDGTNPDARMAAVIFSLVYVGEYRGGSIGQGADVFAASINQNKPEWADADLAAWYFATMATTQAGGDSWRAWNESAMPVLISSQSTNGSWQRPRAVFSGNEIEGTALGALILESCYRLPAKKK